jgi:hypothetical protein
LDDPCCKKSTAGNFEQLSFFQPSLETLAVQLSPLVCFTGCTMARPIKVISLHDDLLRYLRSLLSIPMEKNHHNPWSSFPIKIHTVTIASFYIYIPIILLLKIVGIWLCLKKCCTPESNA